MKGRKQLTRKMPKRNNVFGLKARQASYDAASAQDREAMTRPGSRKK